MSARFQQVREEMSDVVSLLSCRAEEIQTCTSAASPHGTVDHHIVRAPLSWPDACDEFNRALKGLDEIDRRS
jgi:hypothetical protein